MTPIPISAVINLDWEWLHAALSGLMSVNLLLEFVTSRLSLRQKVLFDSFLSCLSPTVLISSLSSLSLSMAIFMVAKASGGPRCPGHAPFPWVTADPTHPKFQGYGRHLGGTIASYSFHILATGYHPFISPAGRFGDSVCYPSLEDRPCVIASVSADSWVYVLMEATCTEPTQSCDHSGGSSEVWSSSWLGCRFCVVLVCPVSLLRSGHGVLWTKGQIQLSLALTSLCFCDPSFPLTSVSGQRSWTVSVMCVFACPTPCSGFFSTFLPHSAHVLVLLHLFLAEKRQLW